MDIRLNEKDQPRTCEEPVSPKDQLALHHNNAYRNSDIDQAKGLINTETSLQLKHDADKIKVEPLDQQLLLINLLTLLQTKYYNLN